MTTHILVIGGGMGGLACAVSALQAGASCTLIEKGPRLGGSAALSNGMLTTYGDLDRFRACAPNGDEQLQTLVCESLPDAAAWLQTLGVELQVLPTVFDRYEGWALSPQQLISRAASTIADLGGTVHSGTSLDQLALGDNGEVTGAYVIDDSATRRKVAADAVVLATGGFQGSPELLGRYAGIDASSVAHRSNPWSTGDGLTAAVAVGAGTTGGLSGFYGHALPAPPARHTAETFADLSQYYGCKSVAINMAGHRFIDETAGAFEENVNEALARQPRGLGFYVFDDATAQEPTSTAITAPPSVIAARAKKAGGVVLTDPTLEGLAARIGELGAPPAVVAATLTNFAAAMAGGNAAGLPVSRTGIGTTLAHGPFTAVHVQSAISFTTGGIAVDDQLRVMRKSHSSAPRSASWITDARDFRFTPISGLYSVGADIGGVSSSGYAGGLATALTTGRAAGLNAAADR
ncbi:FAD-dependent oxidoreductase [Gordonia terrae]|uniref:FAD-dependent oxidoreductase n=1 Tax=Gordonia terrae TaxID=2055 RepID=UPI003F6C1A08